MSTAESAEPKAVSPASVDDAPLYEARKDIFPQAVRGRFRTIKWTILIVTLGIYYFLPFVRWDRGVHAPDQAVLIDLPGRRFYFFFIELWPQELYYVTGLLVLAALALFLTNAVAGRMWCGYLCPQTVWTDLFYAVERLVEGDRREQMRKAASGEWNLERVAEKILKHSLWLMIAWWTGGAWVLYFADAPTLVYDLLTFNGPFVAYVWIGILTVTTYSLAGFMREQVCLYMCPWPRIQAALTDEHALNVTYRYDRGEPRMSAKKADAARARAEPAGDCVDCFQCVNVCPTGVDIRDGSQLGCIQCGLCIDACDNVMAKIGRPSGLIGYDTDENVKRRIAREEPVVRIIRPRTVLYAGLIVGVGALMTATLATRTTLGVSALHDRNPVFVKLADGGVRNAYTVRLTNKALEARPFRLEVLGLPDATLDVVGEPHRAEQSAVLEVESDQTRELRVLVTNPRALDNPSTPVRFRLTDITTGVTAQTGDFFKGPGSN
ncbi:cytochrome c oxidase accessory protein CcoG [Alsobacter sp. SYSU M60028]|uniref:Cytochrome c oxidase accessory protein CcoG n=1 Tax=Alsobacter ponti TaxID=2962936 RepID=A0ABT1L6F5_9HYPH|nr:cytochrome c oxidase accessory protein CcoG [Alsobacter ponti]MCP8936985.1 cytochrome c oxidase accessory protein CcoG [Alsobacter ponti]